jgi:hypothetical protein
MALPQALTALCIIFFIPDLVLAVWVYMDSVSRGMAKKSPTKAAFWTAFTLVPLLGILLYAYMRPKGHMLTCANCRRKVLGSLPRCPHCDALARPPGPPVTYQLPQQPPKKEIKCPYCDKPVQADWKSCPHCGRKLIKDKAIIDEVFLMYKDGRLIKHFTRRIKPDVDQDILSGMLTAVQDFVKDTFRGEEGELNQMKFGRFQILIGHGRFVTIAAVMIGEEIEPFRPQITKTIDDMEGDYEIMLRNWDGDVDQLKVLGRYANDLINGRYS